MTDSMPTQATDQEILEALRPAIRENMLACKEALAVAARLDVAPSRVGKVCNQNEIRIINCQLGCFGTKRSRSR